MRRRYLLAVVLTPLLLSGLLIWWRYAPNSALQPVPQVQGRREHTATLLRDGTILVVGGRPVRGGATNLAERYDPRTGLWRDAGRLRDARLGHTASLLSDGSVMVIGGDSAGLWPWQQHGLTTVERYLPDKNRWVRLASLPQGITRHVAVTLTNDAILVGGGMDRADSYGNPVTAVWRYDPAQNSWQTLASLQEPRASSAGLLLANGHVLIIGGLGGGTGRGPSMRSAEHYDVSRDQWQSSQIEGASLVGGHRATLLPDGRVLIADGESVYLYDPQTDRWRSSAVGTNLFTRGTLTTLPDGRALHVAGKVQAIFNPMTGGWQVRQRTISRLLHTATLLPDGRVVLLGGQSPEQFGPGHDVEFVQP